jgi:hypothetical protein
MPGLFPTLRTGAVAQFPFARELRCSTEVVRFVDGSEQTYRGAGSTGQRWLIDLSLLDSRELAALRAFFEAQKGRWGIFTFVDPASGQSHDNCSSEADVLPERHDGEGRAGTSLVIYQHD